MSYHKDMNKVSETSVSSHDNHQNEFKFYLKTIVPPDLHQIQPRANQVRNCDEIGFDPNGKWQKVVRNYKFFQEEIMWKVQTGERAPFWCTLIVLTRAGGQWFIHPTVVHQDKEYSKYIHHSIPLDCTFYHTPSDYMDIDGWLKTGYGILVLDLECSKHSNF